MVVDPVPRLPRLVYWIAGLVLLWIGVIVLLIARGPDGGAATPEELAARYDVALRDRDIGALDALVAEGTPRSLSTADLMEQRQGLDGVGVAIETDGERPLLVVSGQQADGATVVHRFPVVQDRGRWLVQPTAIP